MRPFHYPCNVDRVRREMANGLVEIWHTTPAWTVYVADMLHGCETRYCPRPVAVWLRMDDGSLVIVRPRRRL